MPKPRAGLFPKQARRNNESLIMKTKFALLALCLCASVAILFTGCKTTGTLTPQSIQNKAKGIAYLVTAESLLQHPEWKEYFQVASLEFATLGASTNVGLPQITQIISELPVKQLKGERAQIYLTVGTMFLQDDLGEVGVSNPAELMRAAQGIHEGIDLAVNLTK